MSAEIAQVAIGVLTLGSTYCLVAVGFVILFRSTGVVNFAQGYFMVVGAFVFYWFATELSLPFPLAIALSLLVAAALGVVVSGVFQRLIGRPLFVVVIATLGLGVVLEAAVFMIWGPGTRVLPAYLSYTPIELGGHFVVNQVEIFTVGCAVVTILCLELGLHRTRLGLRMQSFADRPLLASTMGVNTRAMSGFAWAIASSTAALAGIVYAMQTSLDPTGIPTIGLAAFPAIMLGGLDSIVGAMVGGLVLALVQNVASVTIGGSSSDVSAYVVLLVVLLVRPTGLFGSRDVQRV